MAALITINNKKTVDFMKVYRGNFKCENDKNAMRGVALGNFDGIHAGHAALIRKLTMECEKRNIRSMVYTFENHPNNVIFKDKNTPLIMTEELKKRILEEAGINELFLEHFDEQYAHTPPEDFVKNIIVDRLKASIVVVGYDYTYGDKGSGTADELIKYGAKYGFEVFVIPPVKSVLPSSRDNITISSTVLRNLIQEGKLYDFRVLTGRNYTIPGKVVRGRKVGETLGFPTANILPNDGFALPGFGVYATITHADGKIYRSMTNIGNNPTFDNIKTVTVETYIIGFKGELYGHDIEVEFISKMRGEKKFASTEELTQQLKSDVEERRNMSDGIRRVYEKNGVEIYYVQAERFKTAVLKVMLCDNLSKERAYKNSLIAAILNSGTKKYPTVKSISKRTQELYGASVYTGISSVGEIQFTEFNAEYTEQKYIEEDPDTENEVIDLLFEMISEPETQTYEDEGIVRTGFSEEIFKRERANRDNQIQSLINEKHSFARKRCIEIMCENEPYSVYNLGRICDGEGITPADLYDYYKDYYINKSAVKIFYCGRKYPEHLTECAEKCFKSAERLTLSGGYVEKNITKDDVKDVQETMNVTQGKLFLGYRTNTPPDSENYYAAALCAAVLGQGTQSKLFVNIREKNSLAYYAGASMNRCKGIMLAFCAINPANKEKTLKLMQEQLEAIRRGEISEDEYSSAVKMIKNDLLSYNDSQGQMIEYYFNRSVMGSIIDPAEYARKIEKVSIEDIKNAANRMVLDTVYFLTGNVSECLNPEE